MSANLKQVAVRFEPELHEKLEAKAKAERRPLANLIRLICHEAVERSSETGAAA